MRPTIKTVVGRVTAIIKGLSLRQKRKSAGLETISPNSTTSGLAADGSVRQKSASKREPPPFPILGKLPYRTQVLVTVLLASTFLSLAAAVGGFAINRSGYLQRVAGDATSLEAGSQRLAANLAGAARGEANGFTESDATVNSIESTIVEVVTGAGSEAVAEGPAQPYAIALKEAWEQQKEQLAPLLTGARKYLAPLAANRSRMVNIHNKAIESAERVYMLAAQLGYSNETVSSLSLAMKTLASLNATFSTLATSPVVSAALIQQVESEQKLLASAINDAKRAFAAQRLPDNIATEVRVALNEFADELSDVDNLVAELSGNLKLIVEGKEAAAKAIAMSGDVYMAALSVLTVHLESLRDLSRWYFVSGVLGVLGILSAFLTLRVTNREAARQAFRSQQEVALNENAIENISRGLAIVSNGDLTSKIRVDEAIFGAVVHKLNRLFNKTIAKSLGIAKTTAGNVAKMTSTAAASAEQLKRNADSQSASASDAVASVELMVNGANHVATAARATTVQADASNQAVRKGVDSVNSTLSAMELVSEKSQRQAKLVKRLGERSQEVQIIAQTLGGMADIAKVLALNAAIQAEAAGEAGRGFGVVADEIKSLADNINTSLQTVMQISETTQSDAREALAATDEAIGSVVTATRASEVSAQVLAEIGAATNTTQSLVAQIAELSAQQIQDAEIARKRMGDVSQLSAQTQEAVRTMSEVTNSILAEAEVHAKELAKFITADKKQSPTVSNVLPLHHDSSLLAAAAE